MFFKWLTIKTLGWWPKKNHIYNFLDCKPYLNKRLALHTDSKTKTFLIHIYDVHRLPEEC